MKKLKDLINEDDVFSLSKEEMYYINKEIEKGGEFNNYQVALCFSTWWILQGMDLN